MNFSPNVAEDRVCLDDEPPVETELLEYAGTVYDVAVLVLVDLPPEELVEAVDRVVDVRELPDEELDVVERVDAV